MSNHFDYDLYDLYEDLPGAPRMRHAPSAAKKQKKAPPAVPAAPLPAEEALKAQEDGRTAFDFTYHASRHEREWLSASLGGYFENLWFQDVLRLVRGGKEASVYLCSTHPLTCPEPFLAAKVYRPRRFRNLRKDHLYREGRQNLDANGHIIHDDGMNHAMNKRTAFGMELLHTSWIEHEYLTLELLHAAGADTPQPYTRGNNSILMQYIGDADGCAPTLSEVDLDPHEARPLFQRVLHNIELMLAHKRVHADLSAYNILYWEGKITLIDFPQAIHPDENQNAWRIFQRDVARVCEYFARQGVSSDPHKLAAGLWRSQGYAAAPAPDVRFLDVENPADRRYWEKNRS